MIEIDKLPQFNVQRLLEDALRKLEAAGSIGLDAPVTQAARDQLTAVLAAQPRNLAETRQDTEQALRRIARTLLLLKDPQLQSAGLTIMSAADMLRVA